MTGRSPAANRGSEREGRQPDKRDHPQARSEAGTPSVGPEGQKSKKRIAVKANWAVVSIAMEANWAVVSIAVEGNWAVVSVVLNANCAVFFVVLNGNWAVVFVVGNVDVVVVSFCCCVAISFRALYASCFLSGFFAEI